jgi:hypothetical protein
MAESFHDAVENPDFTRRIGTIENNSKGAQNLFLGNDYKKWQNQYGRFRHLLVWTLPASRERPLFSPGS